MPTVVSVPTPENVLSRTGLIFPTFLTNSFKTVDNTKDLIIITNEGIIIRLAVDKISEMSRVTQGVRLINLREGQKVSSISVVNTEEDNNEE